MSASILSAEEVHLLGLVVKEHRNHALKQIEEAKVYIYDRFQETNQKQEGVKQVLHDGDKNIDRLPAAVQLTRI